MKPFRPSLISLAAIAAIGLPQVAGAAPRAWMLPSETMFVGSGDEWLTVDAAISTDLYYFDHPGQAWEPLAFAPDGTRTEVENKSKGKLRLTFDLHVTQRGTYKIAILADAVIGSYMLDGERRMLPRGTTPATLAQAIPAGATDVWTAENNSRIETFATAGEPTTTVFTVSGKGIEMVPVTHPTDLAVGAPATFRFFLDGKPAADLPVTAVNGGVRYSDGLQQLTLQTGPDGRVIIDFPSAGMWWVSASFGAPRGEGGPPSPASPVPAPAAAAGPAPESPRPPAEPPRRRASYAATVEVID